MSARSELEKKISKKRDEISELRRGLRDAEVWIQALEEALKVLPREGVNDGEATRVLRPGGNAAEARRAILAAGRPLHLDELLEAMGKTLVRSNRTSVSGALSAYVRRDEIFTRPAPNTFGLRELADGARRDDSYVHDPLNESEPPIGDDDVPF